jgi:GT2 family glycosyltransferase/glycosyltransferase involved in cell wall biosynthesis
MNRFWDAVLEPAMAIRHPQVIVEIGAETGKTTEKLLDFCREHDCVVHSIDPRPKFDVAAWQEQHGSRFVFHEARSLEALADIGAVDVALIDGDHNWYTVYNELRLLQEASQEKRREFPLVFLHDIGWPYGRRDLYYNPDDIPEAFRLPFEQRGIQPGESELGATGGVNAHLCNATSEGGARNGVLTAIEDFLQSTNESLELIQLPGLQGLGIILATGTDNQSAELHSILRAIAGEPARETLVAAIENDRNALQVRNAELTQRWEAEKNRSTHQAQLLDEARHAKEEAASLREMSNQTRQAIEEFRAERDVLRSEISAERELLQSEFAAERELLLTETSRQQNEIQRLELESKLRQEALAHEEAEQLRKLKAAISRVSQREEDYAARLLDSGQRLARVHGDLAKVLDGTPARKRDRRHGAALRELAELHEELILHARDLLGGLSGEKSASAGILDARRILPGRSRDDGRSVLLGGSSSAATTNAKGMSVDIVVCVHDALEDVKHCLASLRQHTNAGHGVIFVDDGSDPECAGFLREWSQSLPQCTLLRNDHPRGYTKAANQGLRESQADLVVLLNSDTIVTANWIERIVECATSDPRIGIAGPLSNAASYQSVPELADANGDWALNLPPDGWNVDQVAIAVAQVSPRAFPRVPFVNGFCFAVKRAVIDAIGYFDEEAFPDGYGEENDYCVRAADAGFTLAIADHAYVYHAKSRSYSHEQRHALGKNGRRALLEKYGLERIGAAETRLRNDPDLVRTRQALAARLNEAPPLVDAPSVLFLLPTSGGGGGAHSIVQEATGMRRLGAEVRVAVLAKHLQHYKNTYPALDDADHLFYPFGSVEDLEAYAATFSVVVATIFTSVLILATVVKRNPSVTPAYYIQDYEPYFFPEGSAQRDEAAASYTLIPDALLFAKTNWLCDTVRELHGVDVHKVCPSLDHAVFYPPSTEHQGKRVRIVAMIRPRSARRGAPRTMEVLRRLDAEYGKRIEVHIFGCTDAELAAAGLPTNFRLKNHSILKREEVADLLRCSDIFIDLSDYQAFGRSGLEAMACGCAVVVPALGGTSEYAIHGENTLIVDTADPDACYAAVHELVADPGLRARLRDAGLSKAGEYSIECAARSEVELFRRFSPIMQHAAESELSLLAGEPVDA